MSAIARHCVSAPLPPKSGGEGSGVGGKSQEPPTRLAADAVRHPPHRFAGGGKESGEAA
jgi:hypothetical protein